jgi:hypothetical protein
MGMTAAISQHQDTDTHKKAVKIMELTHEYPILDKMEEEYPY